MLEVYDAIKWYQTNGSLEFGLSSDIFSPRNARNALVAGILHDINHSCKKVADGENMQSAIETFLLHGDKIDVCHPHDMKITTLIKATEFPYTKKTNEYSPMEKILQEISSL
jgi:hypothetical protein